MNSDMWVSSFPRSGRRIFITTLKKIMKNPDDIPRIHAHHNVEPEHIDISTKILRHPIPAAISLWEFRAFNRKQELKEVYCEDNREEFFRFMNQSVERWKWHYETSDHDREFKASFKYQELLLTPVKVYMQIAELYDIDFVEEAYEIINECFDKQAYGGGVYKPRNLTDCPLYSRKAFTHLWMDVDAFFEKHRIILMHI